MEDMRRLRTREAAALLKVSPNTLRAWERRFGFPQPLRSQGRHRLYTHDELVVLRDALHEGLSISSAMSRAQEGMAGDANSLVGALLSFDRTRADFAIEASVALRSVERSVVQVLLPSLDEVVQRKGPDSAAWAFAAGWGSGWLNYLIRLAPRPVRSASLVLGDASRGELDPDAAHILALELMCVRASVRVQTLSVRGVAGIGDAVLRHEPDLVVVAGSHVPDDSIARWAYAIRNTIGRFPLAIYRRGVPHGDRFAMLPRAASDATRRVLELLASHESRRAARATPELHPAAPAAMARAASF